MLLQPLSEVTFNSNAVDIDFYFCSTEELVKHIDYFQSILSNEEIERANKFRFESDRQTFVIAHGALRTILAKALNIKPIEITYTRNNFEKPLIEKPNCHFNLSHTSHYFSIAFSKHRPIGVDIEKFERNIYWRTISKKFFSEKENEIIFKAEENEQIQNFVAFWTRKEAILKVIGCGMVNELKEIDSSSDLFLLPQKPEKLLGLKPESIQYHIKSFLCENHMASIAFAQDFKINKLDLKLD
jgi:4'-phosphopantetheinyl transferase